MPSLGVLPLAGILVLVSAAVLPTAVLDPSGDGTGNLGVTVIDPTATESPSPTPSPSQTPRPGGSGGGSGETPPPSETPSPGPAEVPDDGGWVVMGGVEASAHGEINPLHGWVTASVGLTNRSGSAPASGTMTFRLYNPLGVQIGSKVSHTVTGIAPGETQTVNARLDGVGQWPLLRVVATFTPDAAAAASASDPADPISRETWVIAFPWVLLIGVVLLLASGIIVALRRGTFTRPWSRS